MNQIVTKLHCNGNVIKLVSSKGKSFLKVSDLKKIDNVFCVSEERIYKQSVLCKKGPGPRYISLEDTLEIINATFRRSKKSWILERLIAVVNENNNSTATDYVGDGSNRLFIKILGHSLVKVPNEGE